MGIVVNIYYSGENGSARKFAKEMISSGTVDAIRNEAGNISSIKRENQSKRSRASGKRSKSYPLHHPCW